MDTDVVKLAKKEKRVIITLDLDFGELYYQKGKYPSFGVLIVRLKDQRVESVNFTLNKFFRDSFGKKIFTQKPNSLVVVDELKIRVG